MQFLTTDDDARRQGMDLIGHAASAIRAEEREHLAMLIRKHIVEALG